jgi:hypothetical protein
MNENKWKVALVVIGIIAIIGLFTPQGKALLGGGTRFQNGISADNTAPVAGEVRGTDLTITDDATISGGVLTVTTSNTATSTAIVGCVQTYATSTATAIRLMLSPVNSTASSTNSSAAVSGFAVWGFGSCPI